MTLHHDPIESDPQPGSEVIDLAHASRERARKTDIPVEVFLLSDEGKAEMGALYDTIDNSGRIIRTIAFKIDAMVEKMVRDEEPDIYSLFLHDDGIEGLTSRLELIELYKVNPLVNESLRRGSIKHHLGDEQAQAMYTNARRIFMNMVRYEWLLRIHDPSDPIWVDRARRLGDFNGNEMHTNLQPGFSRTLIVPRNNTPSDFLPRRPRQQ